MASLIVVLHHAALTYPAFSSAYVSSDVPPHGTLLWWLTATPLRMFTFGAEAVVIFFVLSGMVVALPVLRSPDFEWRSYFMSRTLRLWVPVAASVLLAALWISLVPQAGGTNISDWVLYRSTPSLDWSEVLASLDAVRGPTRLNNPLWSIQWEVIFSLLLPVFVWTAVTLRRRPVVLALASGLLVWLGHATSVQSLMYLPVFLVGVIMAVGWSPLQLGMLGVVNHRFGRVFWTAAYALTAIFLSAHWILWSFGVTDPVILAGSQTLVLFGAAALVLCAAVGPLAKKILESFWAQWLGRISFSLYLVHAPILIFYVYLFGANQWLKPVMLAVPTSLLVAQIFFWCIERPSHRLAKAVGSHARTSWNIKAAEKNAGPGGTHPVMRRGI